MKYYNFKLGFVIEFSWRVSKEQGTEIAQAVEYALINSSTVMLPKYASLYFISKEGFKYDY